MNKLYIILFFMVVHQAMFAQPCITNSNSLTFNGTSSYVDLTNATAFVPDSAITVEAWIKPAAFGTASWNNTIVGKDGWTATAGEGGFSLRCGGNGILSFVISGKTFAGAVQSWKEATSTAGSIPLNTWTHVAGTFDGTNIKCYINGVQNGVFAFTGLINKANNYAMKIAKTPEPTQTRYFTGSIDEVRVWKRALTAAELLANKDNHIDPAIQNKLAGYWRLNAGSGNSLVDLSSANNTGTNLGATWNTSVPFSGGLSSSVISGQTSVTPLVAYNYSVTNQSGSTYNWVITNGTITNGQNNDTVSVLWTGAGAGQVLMIETNGACSDTSIINITITSVGLEENIFINYFNVYPNPARDKVNFNFANISYKEIKILNLLGDIVFVENIENKSSIQINTSGFAKGIYLFQLNNNKLNSKTGKLVIE
jgi:hypothetical protein